MTIPISSTILIFPINVETLEKYPMMDIVVIIKKRESKKLKYVSGSVAK
jgi:hypothetical protein